MTRRDPDGGEGDKGTARGGDAMWYTICTRCGGVVAGPHAYGACDECLAAGIVLPGHVFCMPWPDDPDVAYIPADGAEHLAPCRCGD